MLVQYIQYTYLRRCNDIDYRMAAEIYIPISFVGCTIYKSAFGVYVRHLLQAGYERVSLVQKIFGNSRTEYAFAIQHYFLRLSLYLLVTTNFKWRFIAITFLAISSIRQRVIRNLYIPTFRLALFRLYTLRELHSVVRWD